MAPPPAGGHLVDLLEAVRGRDQVDDHVVAVWARELKAIQPSRNPVPYPIVHVMENPYKE